MGIGQGPCHCIASRPSQTVEHRGGFVEPFRELSHVDPDHDVRFEQVATERKADDHFDGGRH